MYQISGPHNPIFENYGGAGPSTSNHQQEIQERTAKEKRERFDFVLSFRARGRLMEKTAKRSKPQTNR